MPTNNANIGITYIDANTPPQTPSDNEVYFCKQSESIWVGNKQHSIGPLEHDITTYSFDDGIDSYFKKVVSTIVPVQAGSGTPSPTNVRAISGFTECTVTDCGKNICDTSGTDTNNGYVSGRYILETGVIHIATYDGFVSEYTPIFSNKTYTISGHTGKSPSICFYDKDKNYLGGIQYNNQSTITFTTPIGTAYYRASIANTHVDTIQIELGSTPTAYEPYTANTATISFGSAGTVYGGEVDLTTGLLTVTYGYVDLGSLNWTYDGSRFYALLSQADQTEGKTSQNAICSIYDWSNLYLQDDKTFFISTNSYLSIWDYSYTDATTFKTAMDGVQLVYELKTPQTYQLTPTQLRSLVGTNNLTSSTGEVTEVEYIRNETISWVIDQIQDNSVEWTVIP